MALTEMKTVLTGYRPMSGDTERYLIIKAKGGFGNRILSAATGAVLAEVTGRTVVIDWRDGGYMPEGVDAYPLLFERPGGVRPAKFDDRTDVTPAVWSGRLGQHPVHVISKDFPNHHSNPFIYRRLSIDLAHPDSPETIAVFWSYLPKLARVRRQLAASAQFRGMSSDALARWALNRYFVPNARVRNEVERLFAGRRRPVIGVHVRYTDRKVSLERIFRDTERVRRIVPAAQIFLATDNAGVQERFRARFNDVFVIEKNLGDDQTTLHEREGRVDHQREAEDALIDMWALSRCDWLVHSRRSTFSVAAALIGGIPRDRQRDIDRWNASTVVKRWIQEWA
ncbi:nodulation protein NodZ [Pseudaminobacter sp. NGMCC 1.201702]|uniref:nodulation protein NodZ n=1 Tax=Pseudaminobacter sp. NGMCC 1.201702 TaxID=3391825 RepID=UPI0039EE7E1E